MILLNDGTIEIQDPGRGELTFPVLPLTLYDVRSDYMQDSGTEADVVISLHLKVQHFTCTDAFAPTVGTE
jgi:hypothetical protein